MISILRLLITVICAFFVGKLVSRIKLPAILGWLITGMILGPHAISIMNQGVLDSTWYQVMIHILECAVGLMIGSELVWNKIKQSGKSIIITTLTQSLGTFIVVSLVFDIIFYFIGMPLYLGFIFGGIALATAPAPALSIVREFKTKGPVTDALIPMAALDDIVGCVVFFTTIAIVAGSLSAGSLPPSMVAIIVLLPLVIGAICGVGAGFILKKETSNKSTLLTVSILILITSCVGFYFNNQVMPSPVLNFMLIGMAFSAAFSNMVSEERLEQIMHVFNPVLGISMILVILNLGTPLDYHLILGAGIFTAIYILSRAIGKYFGAYFGASITKSPNAVKKYLGFTLLPHSGVSLVFTGIVVSALSKSAPDSAQIVQGTIAAAAVINEIIAVIMAKKGFEWAGELSSEVSIQEPVSSQIPNTIITFNRQYGSGGRDIAKQLSEQLNIPFYDGKIIEMAASSSSIKKLDFENYELNIQNQVLNDLADGISSHTSKDDKIFYHNSYIIEQIAKQSSCIIVGRCADYVLRHYDHVINVFIYGDYQTRLDRVIHVYKENPENVEELIHKRDRKRSQYYKQYTQKEFGAAENYDLCLNSSTLGIDECVNIIRNIYQENHA